MQIINKSKVRWYDSHYKTGARKITRSISPTLRRLALSKDELKYLGDPKYVRVGSIEDMILIVPVSKNNNGRSVHPTQRFVTLPMELKSWLNQDTPTIVVGETVDNDKAVVFRKYV